MIDVRSPGALDPAWHSLSVDEVVTELASNASQGLSRSEANRRLDVHGLNQIGRSQRWVRFKRLADQFNDVLIWLLVVASVVSGLLLDAWVDAIAIAAIVLINAAVGYIQETKAQVSLDLLRDLEAPDARVVRGGAGRRVRAVELVPGDILVLEAGDRVAADARLIDSTRVVADEAPLTGESMPVVKGVDPVAADTVVGDRSSMIHAGTTIVSGRGSAVVTRTGSNTEMGLIASLFTGAQPRTPLQLEMTRIGRRLAVVAGFAAVLIFGAGMARGFPVESMILTAVALAVAAIPEGLPAVITVSLAGGVQRMARRNAIVRRLPAVESLGAVDVICTDKTGTLTAPELEMAELWMADGRRGLELLGATDSGIRWLLAAATLTNNALRTEDGWEGDPTEVALLEAVTETDRAARLSASLPRLDEGSFDARRKRMSTLHPDGDQYVLLTKGAPEVLLERSTRYLARAEEHTLDDDERRRLADAADSLAARGMRTLGFAMRRLEFVPADPVDEERDLVFIGMAGLREKVRPEVSDALATAARAGVRTVMVTGDHATTAAAVADSVGLERGEVMAGRELAMMSVDDLTATIDETRVFARVDPADKVKIIEAWQRRGAVVAMTGDGVNDAPALHRADIGVAMGSGTDVARESASMVLTDDNYATIVAAISEGRRLFASLRNVVHYLLSANASEVIYVLIGFLAFGFLGEPLLAVQLLWINLVSDALPAIALGMDRPTRDLMSDPPGQGRDVLSGRNIAMLIYQGSLLAGAAVLTMTIGAFILERDHTTVQTMVFTTLVLSQLLHAINLRSATTASGWPFSRLPKLMWVALIGSSMLHLVVVYTGVGNTFFRTMPLGAVELSWAAAAALLSMLAVWISNRVIAKRTKIPAVQGL